MALRKAQTPPLITRYELLSRECLHLDQTLERQHQDLDRMAKMFDQSWQEQYLRLRVEQEVFSYQIADINTLRTELKHLTQVATQLEPYIRSLTPSQLATQTEKSANEQAEHLASLLQHIGILQQSEALGKIPRSRSRVLGQLLEKVRPNIQERERSKSAGSTANVVTSGGSNLLFRSEREAVVHAAEAEEVGQHSADEHRQAGSSHQGEVARHDVQETKQSTLFQIRFFPTQLCVNLITIKVFQTLS